MHILILVNNLSYKKLYPYSLPSIQLWECPFSLTKGACYQSVEMLPIKWVNKVSRYCLIFICLIIIEMDHFFLSLWTFVPLLSLTSCFQFFVNFLFDWLSFFKFLILNISKIIWIVILSLHMYVTYTFLSTSHLSFTLIFYLFK